MINRGSFLHYIYSSGVAMPTRNPIPFIPPLVTTSRPPQTTTSADDSSDTWGIIIPIVLVGLFLIGVIVCLYCHSLRRKKQQGAPNNAANTSLSRFSHSLVGGSTSGVDYVRSSTRSTTPLRPFRGDEACSQPMAPHFSQGSHAKFTFYWDQDNWKLCPDSLNNMRGHHNPLSPIDEMENSSLLSEDIYTDISKSYEVGVQAPFSPYHLTWVTPQAPPPSYEESEADSPEKRLRLMSINTTNSEDTTYNTTFDKDSNLFHAHNNTPNTDCECSGHNASGVPAKSGALTNTNSQMTSYPSTPLSSTGASLSTSNMGSGDDDDTSFVTSYHDTSYHISRQSVNNQSAAYTSARGSQEESEVSGIPSLPSSILYYHQKMTGKNMDFLNPQFKNQSMVSSMGSTESHYTDNTSLLPNVGSSNTSGNPSLITSHHSHVTGTAEQGITPDDLSKIVNELSSIRPSSTGHVTGNKGIVNSMCTYENNIGESYVTEKIHRRSAADAIGNPRQSTTELFRSWSVTAELDYSSTSPTKGAASMNTPHNENSFSWDNYPWCKYKAQQEQQQQQLMTSQLLEDQNHNVVEPNANASAVDINRLPMPGRKVKFDVPVLVGKTYWV